MISYTNEEWAKILENEINLRCDDDGAIIVNSLIDGVEELQDLVELLDELSSELDEMIRKRNVSVQELTLEGRSRSESIIPFTKYIRGEY